MKTHNWIKIKEEASKQIVSNGEVQVADAQVDPQVPIAVNVRLESSVEQEKVFKCPTCDKMFSRKDHLNRHILIHSGAKPFECDICAKSFSRKDNKYKHMASCLLVNFGIVVKKPHVGVPGFNEFASDPPDFRSLEEKINEKMYEIQCGNLQPINDERDENIDSNEMESKETDETDVEIVLVAPDIMSHNSDEGTYTKDDGVSDDPDNEIKDDSCDDLLTPMKTSDDNKSSSIKSDDGLFRCQVCNKEFLNRNHLNRHAIIHSGVKPFKCDQCDKGFYRMEHLQRHVIVHTGIRPYKCNFCDKSFFQVGDQMKHLMTHINGDAQKSETNDDAVTHDAVGQPQSFPCDKCDKVYMKRSHLKRHYTIHSSQKPFKCEICGQGFSRLEHKKRHMTIHTNQKRYECEFCDKKFNRPDHMLCHIKTHRNVKPYKCNQCGERFETSKEKIEHLRIHSGAYRCEMCHVRFELYVNLIEHRRVVHGVIPKSEFDGKSKAKVKSTDQYPCPICNSTYQVIELSDHIRSHIDDSVDTNIEKNTEANEDIEDIDLLSSVKVKVEVEYDDDDDYNEHAAISDNMGEEYAGETEENGYDENADYDDNGLIEEPDEILQHEDDGEIHSS